jgi:hypothetical protein
VKAGAAVLILALGLLTAPLAAGAQQGERVWRIGILSFAPNPAARPLFLDGFANSVTLKGRTSFSSPDMLAPILAVTRLLRRNSWLPAWMSLWRGAAMTRYLLQRA